MITRIVLQFFPSFSFRDSKWNAIGLTASNFLPFCWGKRIFWLIILYLSLLVNGKHNALLLGNTIFDFVLSNFFLFGAAFFSGAVFFFPYGRLLLLCFSVFCFVPVASISGGGASIRGNVSVPFTIPYIPGSAATGCGANVPVPMTGCGAVLNQSSHHRCCCSFHRWCWSRLLF